VLRIFIVLAGFEPATFGSSGKHNNYYTTKVTTSRYFYFKRKAASTNPYEKFTVSWAAIRADVNIMKQVIKIWD
jgi:hypothetical protein